MMNSAIVTVSETELAERAHVHGQLQALCNDVKKIGDSFSYNPRAGKLFELLSILKSNRISYGTHFDSRITSDLKK